MNDELSPPHNHPAVRCELCGRLDRPDRLDWISREIRQGVELVVYGHIPGEGCNRADAEASPSA